ncbi:hypothetical protein, partial [Streptomyces sp. NPDC002530]
MHRQSRLADTGRSREQDRRTALAAQPRGDRLRLTRPPGEVGGEKSATSTTASSPSSRASRPVSRVQTSPPVSL